MKRKAFVLFSGGLDSATVLYMAMRDFDGNVEAVSCDYGQRHKKEVECAKAICDRLGIVHRTISLGGLLAGDGVMLTNSAIEVPNISYDDIKGVSPTYVPFRNGTMLSAITALAQKYVMEQIDAAVDKRALDQMATKQRATNDARDLVGIYAGQHAEDAKSWAYPDCTFEFLGAIGNAIYVGTYFTCRLITPFVFSSKADIVRAGTELRVPYDMTWSCYKGGEYHCGTCPTCRSRMEAFAQTIGYDPTVYEGTSEATLTPAAETFREGLCDDDEIPF